MREYGAFIYVGKTFFFAWLQKFNLFETIKISLGIMFYFAMFVRGYANMKSMRDVCVDRKFSTTTSRAVARRYLQKSLEFAIEKMMT